MYRTPLIYHVGEFFADASVSLYAGTSDNLPASIQMTAIPTVRLNITHSGVIIDTTLIKRWNPIRYASSTRMDISAAPT